MKRGTEISDSRSKTHPTTRQAARHSSAWPRLSVLVIGSEPAMLDLLHLGFTYEGFDVSVATNAIAALRSATSRQPDLIVLHMPQPDAHELLQALSSQSGGSLVLLLANTGPQDDHGALWEKLARDVDDTFDQPFAFTELMARVRSLLARRGKGIGGRLSFADVTLDRERHIVTRGERPIDLTLREFELLELFLRHPEQVLSRGEILEAIWGEGYNGSDNVLDVYIHLLRAKLEDRPARLIRTVRGEGYVLRTPNQTLRVG